MARECPTRYRHMWRNVVCRSLGMLLVGSCPWVAVGVDAAVAVAPGETYAEEGPPALAHPSLMPTPLTPTSPVAPPGLVPPMASDRPTAGPIENRPMLVVPGVNAPDRPRWRSSP